MAVTEPEDARDRFWPHSGVYASALTCDPEYAQLPLKVLAALLSLGKQIDHHPVARRALEWYAYTEQPVPNYLRDEAAEWLKKFGEIA